MKIKNTVYCKYHRYRKRLEKAGIKLKCCGSMVKAVHWAERNYPGLTINCDKIIYDKNKDKYKETKTPQRTNIKHITPLINQNNENALAVLDETSMYLPNKDRIKQIIVVFK